MSQARQARHSAEDTAEVATPINELAVRRAAKHRAEVSFADDDVLAEVRDIHDHVTHEPERPRAQSLAVTGVFVVAAVISAAFVLRWRNR
jgi:hypothetical protein